MLETMYAAPGVGLAAVQVGIARRLIVLDTSKDEDCCLRRRCRQEDRLSLGVEMRLHEEGCLLIPDVRVEIERPSMVTVRYLDRAGKRKEMAADGLLGDGHPARGRSPEADDRLPVAAEARHHRAQVQEQGEGQAPA